MLRHTQATLIQGAVSPKAAQHRLGHSQISMTMNTYAHALAGYCAALASEPSFLSPSSARTGRLDSKWRIVVNEEVDPDI